MKIKIIIGVLILFIGTKILIKNEKEVINLLGSYIKYNNLKELEKASDLIVIGEPLDEFEKRNHKATYFKDGTQEDIYTITKLKVYEVLVTKENDVKNGEVIEIIEPITLKDNKIITTSDYYALEKEKYVIFLAKNTYGEYSIINMNEGKFKYNNKYKNSDKNSLKYQVYEKYINSN